MWPQQHLGRQASTCIWVLEQNLYVHMNCHFVLPFSVWWWEMKSPCKSYASKKRPQRKKIRWMNDSWKGYLKTWDCWNNQIFRGLCPWTPQGGLTLPPWIPSCKWQCAGTCWGMAYSHKTQSFMKNRGQQKCLDKAL